MVEPFDGNSYVDALAHTMGNQAAIFKQVEATERLPLFGVGNLGVDPYLDFANPEAAAVVTKDLCRYGEHLRTGE